MKTQYQITGMDCGSCASPIGPKLTKLEGVEHASVSFVNQSLSIEYNPSIISEKSIEQAVKKMGYKLIVPNNATEENSQEEKQRLALSSLKSKALFAAAFSLPVFTLDMFFTTLPYANWMMFILSIPVVFWSGSNFFSNAWKQLKRGNANMDTLVSLSTGVAFGFSVFNTLFPSYLLETGIKPHVYYESAVVIITLILAGRYFENRAKWHTSSAIRKLIGLQPKEVTLLDGTQAKVVPIDLVTEGDRVLLKPGEKIPVDGIVSSGESYIDESMISGEPVPALKKEGDAVFSGTINQKGSITIRTTKVGQKTLLAQIVSQVRHAQDSKPPVQKLADRISRIFVPVVLGLAILTFILWYCLGPEPSIRYAILTFMTVLIIACPCALGLATPAALMVGIGKGAENGILIKDAQALESAFKVNTLVLDKTGTLTEGKPSITDLIWTEEADASLLKNIVLSIETHSEHPIAEAIVKHLKTESGEVPVEHFNSLTGRGASASYKGSRYFVGNESLMNENNITFSQTLSQKANALANEGKTVVFVSTKETGLGVIGIHDKLKKESAAVIKSLQKKGIEVYMLTGDNEQTAYEVSKQLGISHYKSSMLPSEKGDFIKRLQEEGRVVAMAGDGINDAPALAQADVGIAMGNGTDIAMESAGITLMTSDLKQIAGSILLSKHTMQNVYQNFFWAFVYNIIAIPVAAGALYPFFGILLSPMIGSAAMAMSDISVLLNALRFKRKAIL